MAKYAPVGPIRFLRQLETCNALGDYHLLIAPDVAAHPQEYDELYDDIVAEGRRPTVILDNGVIESGQAMSPEELLAIEQGLIWPAKYIVLPDVLQDHKATVAACDRFFNVALSQRTKVPQVMRVPQGKTVDEITSCMRDLVDAYPRDDDGYTTWGIPRWFANIFGTRSAFIVHLRNTISSRVRVHLLGMSRFMHDDCTCASMEGVMGIDSANPIVMGLKGRILGVHTYEHMDRGTYWESPRYLEQMCVDNVRYMHKRVQ